MSKQHYQPALLTTSPKTSHLKDVHDQNSSAAHILVHPSSSTAGRLASVDSTHIQITPLKHHFTTAILKGLNGRHRCKFIHKGGRPDRS